MLKALCTNSNLIESHDSYFHFSDQCSSRVFIELVVVLVIIIRLYKYHFIHIFLNTRVNILLMVDLATINQLLIPLSE